MSAQHTPGPWRVEVRPTIVMVLHDARGKGDGYNNRVAECHHWSPASGPQTSPMEAEANARLIVSSPKLLAACEALDAHWLEDWEPPSVDPEQQEPRLLAKETLDIWRTIRAAISEARGLS